LRQGDAIAPLLFNVVLEIAIRRSQVETKGTIFDKCNQIMAYADDVVIMGRRIQDVKETFTSLVEQTNKMGLEINRKKTKLRIMSWKPYNEN
jgi:sorting nexin-29